MSFLLQTQPFSCKSQVMQNNAHIELSKFWPYQVVVLADQISRHTMAVAKDKAGLNLSQWRVLAAVAEKPGRSAADVTAITPMDKTIVSRAVSSLSEAGFIVKSIHKQDKRCSHLDVTAKGKQTYAQIARELNTVIEGFDSSITAESFVTILEEFSAHMKTIAPRSD